MKILDKIALQRLISLILNFILAVLKLVVPKSTENLPNPAEERRKLNLVIPHHHLHIREGF